MVVVVTNSDQMCVCLPFGKGSHLQTHLLCTDSLSLPVDVITEKIEWGKSERGKVQVANFLLLSSSPFSCRKAKETVVLYSSSSTDQVLFLFSVSLLYKALPPPPPPRTLEKKTVHGQCCFCFCCCCCRRIGCYRNPLSREGKSESGKGCLEAVDVQAEA